MATFGTKNVHSAMVYDKIGNPIVLGPLSKQVAYYNDDDVLCILQPSNS